MLSLLLMPCSAAASAVPTVPLRTQYFGVPHQSQHTMAWSGLEAAATAGCDGSILAGDARQLYLLPSLLSEADVQLVMDQTAADEAIFDTTGDTVDDEAVYLRQIVDDGQVVHEALYSAIVPLLQEKLLPYVRSRYDCPSACVADVLIRRYRPSERRRLAVHFDVSSFATAIVSLSNASDYSGGLYVQEAPGLASRRFVPLEVGDGLVHQFDVMHGVQVPSGSRFSLVVWFSDSPDSLASSRAPWVERAAQSGNAEAMFVLSGFYERGNFGHPPDARTATRWLVRAAALRQPLAQLQLAQMLSAAEVTSAELDAIETELGVKIEAQDESQVGGLLLGARSLDGDGAEPYLRQDYGQDDSVDSSLDDSLALAARLYQRVAVVGHPMAQYLLGRCYRRGEGVEVHQSQAEAWLRLAAAQGADAGEQEEVAARWAEQELEQMASGSMADAWNALSPEEQQSALDEINEERQLQGEPEWDMAALERMMSSSSAISY